MPLKNLVYIRKQKLRVGETGVSCSALLATRRDSGKREQVEKTGSQCTAIRGQAACNSKRMAEHLGCSLYMGASEIALAKLGRN